MTTPPDDPPATRADRPDGDPQDAPRGPADSTASIPVSAGGRPDGPEHAPPPAQPPQSSDVLDEAIALQRVAGNGSGHEHVSGRRERRAGRTGAAGSTAFPITRNRPAEIEAATRHLEQWGPPGPMDGPPRRAWREKARSRAVRLAAIDAWMDSLPGPGSELPPDAVLDATIRSCLATAESTARGISVLPAARVARMERVFAALDDAEAALLLRAPDSYLRGQLPALVTHVAAHLPPANAERVHVEHLGKAPTEPISPADRAALVSAFSAASSAARREHARLRSFRNVLIMTSLALLVLAAGIAFVGVLRPAWIPLCFAPQTLEKVVCPTQESALSSASVAAAGAAGETPDADGTVATDGTGQDATGTVAGVGTELDAVVATAAQGQDVALVMLLGLVAAAVTGAAAIRRTRGTSTPFAVPVALIALKLPLGALTAVVGLLLLGGGFVPGLSALDSSGQILAWAVVFGAAQQLVTGLVDKRAQSVLDSVGSAPMTADKE